MKDLARLFRALADETRLAMLALLLGHGELCVCDFERVLGITQSKASRHLRYLLHAGLVEDRRAASWVYYRLREPMEPDRRALVESLGPLLTRRQGALDAALLEWLARKAGTSPPCPPPAAGGGPPLLRRPDEAKDIARPSAASPTTLPVEPLPRDPDDGERR